MAEDILPSKLTAEFNPVRQQSDLTSEERNILWRLRNKKLIYLLGVYLSLSYLFVEVWVWGYDGAYFEAIKELFRFRVYPTWFFLFLFIILTIYFTRYFLKS